MGCFPAVHVCKDHSKTFPANSTVHGARCAICVGCAAPPNGSSLVTPLGSLRTTGAPLEQVIQTWSVGSRCHIALTAAGSRGSKLPRIGAMAARSSTLRAAAQAAGKARSPSFRPFDGRFPLVALRHTNTWCPRDRVLSTSRSAILPGGPVAQPKLTQSKTQAAFLFPPMSVAVSPRSALGSNAP